MEILIKWLETNYSAYVGSTNPAKLSMMKAPRDEIQRAGFPLCALRDLRAMISTLTTRDHRSIYLRVLSDRLDRILESVQARPDDRIEVKAEPMDLDGQHNQDDSVMTTHSETRVRRRMVTSRSYLQVSEPHDVVMKESEHDNVEEETHPHGQEGGMQSDTGARVKIEWPGTQSTPIPIDCDEDESGGNDTATGSATSRPSSYPFDEDELNTRELVALGRKLLLDRGVPIEEVDVLVPDPQRLVSRMLRYPFSPAEIQLRTKLGWKRQRLRTMGVQASAIDACLPMPSP